MAAYRRLTSILLALSCTTILCADASSTVASENGQRNVDGQSPAQHSLVRRGRYVGELFHATARRPSRRRNVDRLAREGTRFQNAFVTAPVCSPCRSAMITGMYQTSIGAHHHRSGRGAEDDSPCGRRSARFRRCFKGPATSRASASGLRMSITWERGAWQRRGNRARRTTTSHGTPASTMVRIGGHASRVNPFHASATCGRKVTRRHGLQC